MLHYFLLLNFFILFLTYLYTLYGQEVYLLFLFVPCEAYFLVVTQ